MPWIKLDDKWMDHPKIMRAGRDARDMWLASITWSARHLTDGNIPKEMLPALAIMAGIDIANCQNFARVLLDVCLWNATENGYEIHDYLEYNPTKEQAIANKEARKDAGRRGGLAKAKQNASKSLAKVKQKSSKSLPRTRTPSRTPSRTRTNTPINGINGDNKVVVGGQKIEIPAATTSQTFSTDPADRIWRKIKPASLVIPPTLRETTIPVIDLALQKNGGDEDKTAAEGKIYFDAWCKRRGKDGKYYSPSGRGWLDWWAQGEIPPKNGAGDEPHYSELHE